MVLFEQLSVLMDENGYSEDDKRLLADHIFPFSDKIVKMIENHSPIAQIHETFLQEENSHFLWAGKKNGCRLLMACRGKTVYEPE